MNQQTAELILHNGKIATQDDRRSVVEAAAIRGGKFLAAGSDRDVMRFPKLTRILAGLSGGSQHIALKIEPKQLCSEAIDHIHVVPADIESAGQPRVLHLPHEFSVIIENLRYYIKLKTISHLYEN